MRFFAAFVLGIVAIAVSGCGGGVDSGKHGENPVAALAGSGALATFTGVSFEFDGSASTDSDGFIVEWAWDFGDGNTTTGQVVEHVYAAPGNLAATLTVRDDSNRTNTLQIPMTVAAIGDMAGNWSLQGTPPSFLCDYAVAFPAPDLNILVAGSAITAVPSITGTTLSGGFEDDGRLLLSATTNTTSQTCGAATIDEVIEAIALRFETTTEITGTFTMLFDWSDPFCNCTASFALEGDQD